MLAAWYRGVEWPRREPFGYHYVEASFMLESFWDLLCFDSIRVRPNIHATLLVDNKHEGAGRFIKHRKRFKSKHLL